MKDIPIDDLSPCHHVLCSTDDHSTTRSPPCALIVRTATQLVAVLEVDRLDVVDEPVLQEADVRRLERQTDGQQSLEELLMHLLVVGAVEVRLAEHLLLRLEVFHRHAVDAVELRLVARVERAVNDGVEYLHVLAIQVVVEDAERLVPHERFRDLEGAHR